MACFVAAVRRATDRRRALEVVGVCLIAVGAVIFAVLAALLNVVADVGQDPRQRTALRAVFWSAMHVLNVTAKVLIVLGAVIALAATLAGRRPAPGAAGASWPPRPGPRWPARGEGRGGRGGHRRSAWSAWSGRWPWPSWSSGWVRSALIVLGAVWVFDLIGASSWVAGRTRRVRAG